MKNINIEEVKRYLKRSLKKKVKITTSLIVLFIMSNSIISMAAWLAVDKGIIGQDGTDKIKMGYKKGSVALNPKDENASVPQKEVVEEYSIAIGLGAEAKIKDSVAIGFGAKTESVEYYNSDTLDEKLKKNKDSSQSTAIGTKTVAVDQATSVGNDTYAIGRSSIAIGSDDNKQFREETTAYDFNKYFKKLYDKIGTGDGSKYGAKNGKYRQFTETDFSYNYSPTLAASDGGIAIGTRALSYGIGATSIGAMSYALGNYSTAMGAKTRAEGKGAIAIGNSTKVFSDHSVAVGNENQILQNGGTAYGYKAYSAGKNSIAIGTEVYSNTTLVDDKKGIHSNYIGNDNNTLFETTYMTRDIDQVINARETKIKEEDSLNVVKEEKNEVSNVIKGKDGSDNSVVLGTKSMATESNSIALGHGTFSLAKNSMAFGAFSYVKGNNSLGLGVDSKVFSDNSIAIGTRAGVGYNSANSLVMGNFSYSTGENALVFGNKSKVTAKDGLAIGSNSEVSLANSTALGVNSKTDYNPAWLAEPGYAPKGAISSLTSTGIGVVSIGTIGKERRLTNLASGYRDTDAVNVSQLRSLEEKLSAVNPGEEDTTMINYLSVDKKNASGEGYKAKEIVMKEVYYKEYVKLKAQALEIEVRKQKNGESFNSEYTEKIKKRIAELEGKNINAIDEAKKNTYGKYDDAYIKNSGKTVDTILKEISDDKDKALAKKQSDILSEEEIVKVKASNYNNDGATGADAIALGYGANANGSQAVAIGKNAEGIGQASVSIGEKALAKGLDSIAIGKGTKSNATQSYVFGSESEISKDASQSSAIGYKVSVKSSQAVAMGNDVVIEENSRGAVAIGSDDSYYNEGNNKIDGNYTKTTAKGNATTAIGAHAQATNVAATALGARAFATEKETVAVGANSKASVEGAVAIGSYSLADRTKNTTYYNPETGNTDGNVANKLATKAALSIGDAKNGVTRQLIGLAAGTDDTDAVNVWQLKQLKKYFDKKSGNDSAGTVVYTDSEGNKLVKANDGKYYIPGEIKDDGTVKTKEENNNIEPKGYDNPELRLVNAKGETTKAIILNNIANGIKNLTNGTTAISATNAKTAVSTLLTQTEGLNKAVNVGDLQALAQAGLEFGANTGTATHQALGTTLNIKGKDGVTYNDDYTSDNVATKVTNGNIEIGFKKSPTFTKVTVGGENKTEITDSGIDITKKVSNVDKTVKFGIDDNGNATLTDARNSTASPIVTEKSLGEQKIKYKATNGNKTTPEKETTLTNGFNFSDGTNTKAEVAENGVVKFDLKDKLTGITSIEKGTNGAKITLNENDITVNDKKLTGIADGSISDNSKDAINGGQLHTELKKKLDKTTYETDKQTFATKNEITNKLDNVTLNSSDNSVTIEDKTANNSKSKTYDLKVKASGTISENDEKAVSGKTVHTYVEEIKNNFTTSLGDYAKKDLDNITPKGKEEIKKLVNVSKAEGDDNILDITGGTETNGQAKNYKLSVKKSKVQEIAKEEAKKFVSDSVQVSSTDGAINVEADKTTDTNVINYKLTLNQDKIKELAGTTNVDKTYAKVDGSNIKDLKADNKKAWATGIGASSITDTTKDQLVTGSAVKTYVDGKMLKFAGNTGDESEVLLGNKLSIVGEGDKTTTETAENNITVDSDKTNKKLTVKLAKDLQNIGSVTFKQGDKTTKISIDNSTGDLNITKNGDTKVEKILTTNNIGSQEITYKANSGDSKTTSLTTGFDFTSTDLEIKTEDNGKVTFNLKDEIKNSLNGKGNDGRDGKNGTAGNHGLTGQDGLNGKDLTNKVNALRNGEAGTVVYTDKDGNRLVKANDGKYYKSSEVEANGDVKADAKDKGVENPELRLVDAKGETTKAITLNNLASALSERDADKAITAEKAKEVVAALLTKTDGLDKAVNLADLQAIAQAGLDFSGNTGDTLHRALGTKLQIVGERTSTDNFVGASDNINVKAIEDANNKISKLEIQLAKALKNIESIQNENTKITLDENKGVAINGKDGGTIVVEGKDGKDGVSIKGGDGTNSPTIAFNKTADNKGTGTITGLKDFDVNDKDYGKEDSGIAATQKEVKDVLNKINANGTEQSKLKNGTLGTVVYTDKDGNKLMKDTDGKFYKAKDNGTKEDNATEVASEDVILSTVNSDGKTKEPITLGNVASALGLSKDDKGNKKNEILNKLINKEADNNLKYTEAELNKVVTLRDLQFLASKGITFAGSTGTANKYLGDTITINGSNSTGLTNDNFATKYETKNIAVKVDNKTGNIEVGLAKELSKINSITSEKDENDNTQTKITLSKDGATFGVEKEVLDGKQTKTQQVGAKTTIGKDGISVTKKGEQNPSVSIKAGDKTTGASIDFAKGNDNKGTGSIIGLKDLDKNSDGHMAANKNYVDEKVKTVEEKVKTITENVKNLNNKGLKFAGNSGTTKANKLGDTVNIKGEGTDHNNFESAKGNINVVANDSGVELKLAANLKNMKSFETEKDGNGNRTKLDQKGLTITDNDNANSGTKENPKNTVEITKDKIVFKKEYKDGNDNKSDNGIVIDNSKGTISGVKDGDTPDSVVTKGYVDNKLKSLDERKPFEYYEKNNDAVLGKDGKAYKAGNIVTENGDVYAKGTQEVEGRYFKESDKVTKQADGKFYKESDIKDKKYDENKKQWVGNDGAATTPPTEATPEQPLTGDALTAQEDNPTKLIKGKDGKFYKEADIKDATYDEANNKYTKNGTELTGKEAKDVVIKAQPNSNPMTLTNIGDGRIIANSTDAVNGGQVYEALKGKLNLDGSNLDDKSKEALIKKLSDGANIDTPKNILVTDKQVSDHLTKNYYNKSKIDEKIGDVDKKSTIALEKSELALGGVANAVAMANLVQVNSYSRHRHNLSAAYGYYGGSHALAIGFSGTNEERNFVYKLSGSVNNKGNLAFGVGAGVMLGEEHDTFTSIDNKKIKEVTKKLDEANKKISEYEDDKKQTAKKFKELEEKYENDKKESNKKLQEMERKLEMLMKKFK